MLGLSLADVTLLLDGIIFGLASIFAQETLTIPEVKSEA